MALNIFHTISLQGQNSFLKPKIRFGIASRKGPFEMPGSNDFYTGIRGINPLLTPLPTMQTLPENHRASIWRKVEKTNQTLPQVMVGFRKLLNTCHRPDFETDALSFIELAYDVSHQNASSQLLPIHNSKFGTHQHVNQRRKEIIQLVGAQKLTQLEKLGIIANRLNDKPAMDSVELLEEALFHPNNRLPRPEIILNGLKTLEERLDQKAPLPDLMRDLQFIDEKARLQYVIERHPNGDEIYHQKLVKLMPKLNNLTDERIQRFQKGEINNRKDENCDRALSKIQQKVMPLVGGAFYHLLTQEYETYQGKH